MTWFKVDDTLAFHEKTVRAGNPAMGLWVRAGSWAAQQLTDGFVPDHMVTTLGTSTQAKALAEVGLWHRDGNGYRFHCWLDYNPTAEEVRADQARKHEAKVNAGRAGGLASGVARRKHTRSKDEANAKQDPKQNGSKTKPRPDPSRPDPAVVSVETSLGGLTEVDARPAAPPLFPKHCTRHGNTAIPGKCGDCADAREAWQAMQMPDGPLPDYRLRVIPPLCGECDERWINTPTGVKHCPRCHPAEASSQLQDCSMHPGNPMTACGKCDEAREKYIKEMSAS